MHTMDFALSFTWWNVSKLTVTVIDRLEMLSQRFQNRVLNNYLLQRVSTKFS